jgi:hypothetical protein
MGFSRAMRRHFAATNLALMAARHAEIGGWTISKHWRAERQSERWR